MVGVAFAVEQGQDQIGLGRAGLQQRPDGVVVGGEGVAVLAPLRVEEDGGVVAGVRVAFWLEGGEAVSALGPGQAEVGGGRVGVPVVEVSFAAGGEDVVGGRRLLPLLGVLIVIGSGSG